MKCVGFLRGCVVRGCAAAARLIARLFPPHVTEASDEYGNWGIP